MNERLGQKPMTEAKLSVYQHSVDYDFEWQNSALLKRLVRVRAPSGRPNFSWAADASGSNGAF